ncbi:hypothetical protein D3C75_1290520 [compost metagenome]
MNINLPAGRHQFAVFLDKLILEPGEIAANRIEQIDLAALQQHHNRSSCDRLGHRI